MNANRTYIKSLDGVRAIAILLVMTFHAEITRFGWMGVQLFFVLSGYLIIGILWKEKFSDTAPSFKFKKFWTRRALRIFPLYFAYILFLVLSYKFFNSPASLPQYLPFLLTYTFNYTLHLPVINLPVFTFLWSLSVEEQFYIFFPFIILLCAPKFTKRLMITIIFAGPLIRYALGVWFEKEGLTSNVTATSVYFNTLSHLDAFFIGGIIPVLSLDKKIKKPQLVFLISGLVALAAGLIKFLYAKTNGSYFTDFGYRNDETILYEHVWQYTLLNILFASFILLLVSDNKTKFSQSVCKILETNWVVRIGKVSYGMYVFHWIIVVYFYNHLFHPQNVWVRIALFPLCVLIVYVVAEISFRLYESRFLKLKDKLSYKTQPADKVSHAMPIKDSVSVLK